MTVQAPRLVVDIKAVEENAARVVQKCALAGITVSGVTKGMCALPEIASALVSGGCTELADSRMKNISALRRMGIGLPLLLLRVPMLSELPLVAAEADCTLVSEPEAVRALQRECEFLVNSHEVIVMIDLGDLREGIWMGQTEEMARVLAQSHRIRCRGVGVNFGCYGGTLPTTSKLEQLISIGKELERELGYPLETFSGGATSSLLLLEQNAVPKGINNLRIGEAILLGSDATSMRAIPWLRRDTMRLEAEIVELKRKPSVPVGPAGADAFGNIPEFEDRGERLRAIAAIGRQDVRIEGLTPENSGIIILGGSSDHMILDVEEAGGGLAVGSTVAFFPDYGAMLALATSPYVSLEVV